MRCFVSVFIPKPNDTLTTSPLLTPRTDPSHSSGSSTASASICTPDEDTLTITRMKHKKSWISWIVSNKSKNKNPTPWQDSLPTPPTQTIIQPDPDVTDADDDDDETSDDSDDYDEPISISTHPTNPTIVTPQSHPNFKILISNKLAPQINSSPFFHTPDTPLFPCSSNPHHVLPPQHSLRSQIHTSRLLHGPNCPFSPKEELHFKNQPILPPAIHRGQTPIDEEYVDEKYITSTSQGLRTWLSCPCFEEHFSVWFPAQDSTGFVQQIVTSTGFAVPKLEFSEHVEFMAGLNNGVEIDRLHPELEITPPKEVNNNTGETWFIFKIFPRSMSPHLQVPTVVCNTPYKTLPSPLRMQHSPQPPPQAQVSPNTPSSHDSSPTTPTTTKRGV